MADQWVRSGWTKQTVVSDTYLWVLRRKMMLGLAQAAEGQIPTRLEGDNPVPFLAAQPYV